MPRPYHSRRIGFAALLFKLFEVFFMKSSFLKLSLWLALCAATAANAAPPVHPEVKACKSDLKTCERSLREAPINKLEVLCEQLLPAACARLIDRYQNEARDAAAGEEPAVCREGTPTWNEAACKTAALQAVARMNAVTTDGTFPAARLDALPPMCRKHSDGELCVEVAERLWDGGRYPESVNMLKRACSLKNQSACDSVKSLAGLDNKVLSAPARAGMPCGKYVAANGMFDEFTFVDRGAVEGKYGMKMNARLEGGLVRMQHDKGGDFVLRYLADGSLLGLDTFTRYSLYKRDGGKEKCAAP
jgi:hypothetical protein